MPTENRITGQPDDVKRYRFKGAAGDNVYAADFDSARRCFLDATERCLAAERREQALQLRLNAADQQIDELSGMLQHLIDNPYRFTDSYRARIAAALQPTESGASE